MYVYEFIKKINKENIINRQTIEYLYLKNRCEKSMADDWETIFNIASKVFDDNQFEIQLYSHNCKNNDLHDAYEYIVYEYHMKFHIQFSLRLIIKYDNITITNTNNDKNEIKDLYVIINFEHKNGLSIQKIKGIRTTFSNGEFVNGYIHSHLPVQSLSIIQTLFSANFCIGNDELSTLVNKLKIPNLFSNELLTLLLLQIEPYLSWESLEGVPYIKIETIKDYGNEVILNSINERNIQLKCIDLFKFTLISDENINFEFSYEKMRYEIIEDEYLINFLSYHFSDYSYLESKGKYYDINVITNDKTYTHKYEIMFNNKELQTIVYGKLIENPVLTIHPLVKTIIIETLNGILNFKMLEYYATKKSKNNPS
jgi:hypothetical protein